MDKERIKEAIENFWKDRNTDNSRYLSWEHCYKAFCDARGKDLSDDDIDILCLHLAFYLASWGMYRGSSFLLQKDYKVHKEIVEEIMQPKYNVLSGIECKNYGDNELNLLFGPEGLVSFMKKKYREIRGSTVNGEIQSDITDTLITKVLMGTLGCVPAYDRFFIAGIRNQELKPSKFNKESVCKLVKFYQDHCETFEDIREEMKIRDPDLKYPQMKILDMGFWQIGYDKSS